MFKVFVGNLPYAVEESELAEVFAECGEVLSCKVIKDKFTGQSKGFAFVEFAAKEAMEEAVRTLDGGQIKGRMIKVSEARPQQARPQRSGGGGGGGGGYRGGGGDRRGGY